MSEPGDPRSERIRVLIALGRWQQARDAAGSLLAERPDDPRLMGWLAQAEIGLKNPTGALDVANRMTGVAPDSEWAHRLRSLALQELGHRDLAVAAAREAARLEPHMAVTHQRLAQALASGRHPFRRHREQLAEAQRAAAEALRLDPDSPDAHFVVGWVAHKGGDPAAARTAYRRTLALAPGHSAALNNLTVLGSASALRAVRGYTRALSIDPHSEVAQRNLHRAMALMAFNLYAIASVAVIAGFILGRLEGGPGLLTYLVALVYVVASAGYVVRVRGRVPRGAWRATTSRFGVPWAAVANAIGSITLAVIVLVVCLTPVGVHLGSVAFRPMILVLAVLVVRRLRMRVRA